MEDAFQHLAWNGEKRDGSVVRHQALVAGLVDRGDVGGLPVCREMPSRQRYRLNIFACALCATAKSKKPLLSILGAPMSCFFTESSQQKHLDALITA